MSTNYKSNSKKQKNKIKIYLDYEKRRLEYSLDPDKTLKEFKEEIFFPIIPDIHFLYNNTINLSQFENEKLFILFKDKTQVNIQGVSNKDFTQENINEVNNKLSGSRNHIFANSLNKSFDNEDFKLCCSCKKNIGKSFCRKCMILLCDECKENVINH